MIGGTLAFSTASSALIRENPDSNANTPIRSSLKKSLNFNPAISCSISSSSSSSSSSRNYNVPKLEPFSRSKLERAIKEPPLIEKSEKLLADYCSVLEGEDSYDCWKAYFELKDLQKEAPKEDVERLIIEAGGVKSLVGYLHGVPSIYKLRKEALKSKSERKEAESKSKSEAEAMNEERREPKHIPDGVPRPLEEIEEEEKARMPDSPFTRLLRVRGKHPAWYS